MQVTVVPGVRLEHKVSVSIDAKEVGTQLDVVATEIARKVQVPGGYRKFALKVARVRQLYRKDISAQVASDIIQETVFKAIQETGLDTLGTPEVVHMDMPWYGTGFSYSVRVEARPTFEKLHYKGLLLPVTGREVTTEMVDEAVERVRSEHIERIPFTGALLEQGLEVELAAEPVTDDPELLESLTRALTLILGPDAVRPFLLEKLVGAPVGSVIEVDAPAGQMPGWTEPSKREVEVRWKVTVTDPKSLVRPPADDELARKAGNNSLLALRGALREKLEKELKDEENRVQSEAIADQLVGRNRIRLPERVVSEIYQERLKEKARVLKQSYPDVGEELLTRLLQYQASEELYRTILGTRLEFVLEEVARLEQITVSDEELEARIDELAEESEMSEEYVRSRIGDEEKESLRHSLRRQRAREVVTRHAVRIPAEEYAAQDRRLRAASMHGRRVRKSSGFRRARARRARNNG
ncbi:MAG: hypothetical protein FJ109_11770 [Deltaproteobacteria bacterium]|nr:hypothetical protein [Deltaproteobacteria bacterium]